MLMGSIIGFERRRADRPAGVRTMAMVCLGACVFTVSSNTYLLTAAVLTAALLTAAHTTPGATLTATLTRCVFTFNSMFAFVDGTMGWDASRVSAAIPSGVGFLGAASIWKGTQPKGGDGGMHAPEVHGLTTATSVWFSAAIGLLCGGGLYVPAAFATALSVIYLRFAPRLSWDRETQEDELEEFKALDEASALDAQLRQADRSRNPSSSTISSYLRHGSMDRNPSMTSMSNSMSSISSFFAVSIIRP